MIVISTVMAPADSPRLALPTASHDFLATVDYPLRPATTRAWWSKPRERPRWRRCYFPQSFPVYRMQRAVSVLLCLLVVLLLSLVAFVLVQVSPPQDLLRGRFGYVDDLGRLGEAGESEGGQGGGGLDVVRTARKLEDQPEYKRSTEDEYNSVGNPEDDEDDPDDLVLDEDDYDGGYEDEDEDGEVYNPVFDMKYFDFSISTGEGDKNVPEVKVTVKKSSNFKTPKVRERWRNLPRVTLTNDRGLKVVEDGVVFSSAVEDLLQESGLSDITVGEVQSQLRSHNVVKLQEPTWERCGRPKNQWVELSTGGAACARYRYPDDYLLAGEVLSFYLSRVLGVGHVPPVVLSEPSHARWTPVAQDMARAGWGEAPVVVLTPWVERLVRDRMPRILLNSLLKGVSISVLEDPKLRGASRHQQAVVGDARPPKDTTLKGISDHDLAQLVQWSDLLVFDYLTGNYDRVAYMQDAAAKEGQPLILNGTIHNLVRSEATDALWLLDNESGLLDAYSLLYGASDPAQAARFKSFHTQALRSTCVFRRSTMEAILGLANHPEPHRLLTTFFRDHEPLAVRLPDPLSNQYFVRHFGERVREVHSWMVKCAEAVQRRAKGRRVRR